MVKEESPRHGDWNERGALIEAGKKLDIETDGSWVRDGIRRYLEPHADKQVLLIDQRGNELLVVKSLKEAK